MLLLLCGPPGAGKTTVATRLQERLQSRGRSFRMARSDDYATRTYERLYDLVAGSDADWIVDGTFYRRRWQRRFHALDDAVLVHLTADLDTCLERNRARPDPISEQGVHVVWREFDEPDADLTVDTGVTAPDAAVAEIVALLGRRGRLP